MTADDWTPMVWSHAAVMDMAARLDPARMTMYADEWQACVDTIRDVLAELNRAISTQLDASWRGLGADGAAAALRWYVTGSLDGLIACRSVAVHLYELSRAAGDLRACITPPGSGETAGQRLGEALAQVRQLYSGPAVTAGSAVADIPAPPEPFAIGSRPDTGALPSTPAPAVSPAGVAGPATGSPAGSESLPEFSRTPLASPGASPFGTERNSLWDTPTHSSALSPSPSSLVTHSPPVQAEPPSTTSGPVAATAPGQSPAAARATSPTAAPFLGTAYPGHYGRDDGGDHRAPRYLVSAWNTNELIGEAPLVAPPVIGE